MPETSTADVTLRRLQRFQVEPGTTCAWRLVLDGRVVAAGKTAADAANLLTISRVTVAVARRTSVDQGEEVTGSRFPAGLAGFGA